MKFSVHSNKGFISVYQGKNISLNVPFRVST